MKYVHMFNSEVVFEWRLDILEKPYFERKFLKFKPRLVSFRHNLNCIIMPEKIVKSFDCRTALLTYYEFIRYFHQSWIPKLQFFLTNIWYDFFFNWQTEKKTVLEIKNPFSFSTVQTNNLFVKSKNETTNSWI